MEQVPGKSDTDWDLADVRMPDADQSAEIKQILKKDPWTPAIDHLAEVHHIEASEAVCEVEDGHDFAAPDSWVARVR